MAITFHVTGVISGRYLRPDTSIFYQKILQKVHVSCVKITR